MNLTVQVNGLDRAYPREIVKLEGLLIYVLQEIKREGLILVDIKVDGKDLMEEYPHQARDMSLSELGTVAITADTTESFTHSFIAQAPQFIEHLKNGFALTVKLFREPGSEEAAHDMLARSFDSFSAIRGMLDDIHSSGAVLDADDTMEQIWTGFSGLADRINRAQIDMDSTELADVIETEMIPFLEEWKLAA